MELFNRVFLLIAAGLATGISGCSFDGLLASCHMTVGGIPMQASARINHCHNPIDITFLLQSAQDLTHIHKGRRHHPISWQYTYVTSNQPESLEIPGSDRRVLLHLVAESNVTRHEYGLTGKVKVRAQFLVDGHAAAEGALTFLDETVRIAHFDDCAAKREDDVVGKIAMAAISVVIILCVLGVAGLLFYHRTHNNRSDDQVDLVNNMERSHASPRKLNTPSCTQEQEQQRAQPPPPEASSASKEAAIHYVVPNNTKAENGQQDATENQEPKVFVSTPNGLKKMESFSPAKPAPQTKSKDKRRSEAEAEHIPPPLPPKGVPAAVTDPLGVKSLNQVDSFSSRKKKPLSPTASLSTSESSSTASDQSRGAIPKRRPKTNLAAVENDNSESNSSSSFPSPLR